MKEAAVLSVLCVDDNPLVGQSIERLLAGAPGMSWEGWLPDGAGVIDAVTRRAPSVVLMDVDIPGTDTFALVKQIADDMPDTHVLMLSGHMRHDYIKSAVQAGAMGYVGKHRAPQTIVDAVKRVADGEFYLCDDAAAALTSSN